MVIVKSLVRVTVTVSVRDAVTVAEQLACLVTVTSTVLVDRGATIDDDDAGHSVEVIVEVSVTVTVVVVADAIAGTEAEAVTVTNLVTV